MRIESVADRGRIMLSVNELGIVRELVRQRLPKSRVWVFGSRCRDWPGALRFRAGSDLDLALADLPEKHLNTIGHLRLDFEEADLPFSVDLVPLDDLPAHMQADVLATAAPLFADDPSLSISANPRGA